MRKPSEYGVLLRQRREALDMTAAQLAQAAGVDASTIYFIESGRTQRPHRMIAAALTKALNRCERRYARPMPTT